MIFLAFLCLLVVSVVLTFIGLDTQKQDARVINLAGRQRMLLQQMRTLVLSMQAGAVDEDVPALLAAAGTFEQTLSALRGGGSILDYTGERFELPPPSSPTLKTELDQLAQAWEEIRAGIDRLSHAPTADTIQATAHQMELRAPAAIDQADRVVRAFEAISTGQVARLRTYQLVFLAAGLALLSTGWWYTQRSIVRPLSHLEQSAGRIGAGEFSAPVQIEGPAEVKLLGSTMETMRAQLLASRLDLQQWAETLEQRVHQRTRELEALAGVSREINAQLSIEKVLTSVTEKARALLGAEVASLCLLNPDGKILSLHAAAAPETAIQDNQSPANHLVLGQVLQQNCTHLCSQPGFCQIVAPAFRASHLAAPLYAREQVIGALCVGSSTPNRFSPEMAIVLAQLCDAAAVALENSRLYQQAEYVATLEERQRIAAEMHDGLLQTMNFMRLMAQMLKEQLAAGEAEKVPVTLRQIERAEEQAEREIRQAIDSLQDDYPLNDTLQERLGVLAAELSLNQPPVTFENRVVRPLVLSRQESEQVLRVAREAALNAQRYSQASQIAILLEKHADEVVLAVADQGVGFAPEQTPKDGRAHFGLKIMRARSARLGGHLSIQSAPGVGTQVELRWKPAAQTERYP